MTPKQIEDVIGKLGLTQNGAARFLRVDDRTVRRWIAGDRDVPPTTAFFLRYLIAAKIAPEEVEKIAAKVKL